jgi:hypothetical protein
MLSSWGSRERAERVWTQWDVALLPRCSHLSTGPRLISGEQGRDWRGEGQLEVAGVERHYFPQRWQEVQGQQDLWRMH